MIIREIIRRVVSQQPMLQLLQDGSASFEVTYQMYVFCTAGHQCKVRDLISELRRSLFVTADLQPHLLSHGKEQELFFAMAEEVGGGDQLLQTGTGAARYADRDLVPGQYKYIHLIGHLKKQTHPGAIGERA